MLQLTVTVYWQSCPGLASGQCSGSLPAAAADDDDGWLYRRTPNLRPSGSTSVITLLASRWGDVQCMCTVSFERVIDYTVCCQNLITPHLTSFLTGQERRDDSMTKKTMTSRSHVKFGPCCWPPPQLIFGNSYTEFNVRRRPKSLCNKEKMK